MKVVERSDKNKSSKVSGQKDGVKEIVGILQDYNFSPKGGIEGFLVEEKGQQVSQVNVSPEFGGLIAAAVEVGQTINVSVAKDKKAEDHGPGAHPVYKLVALANDDGEILNLAPASEKAEIEVSGVIKRWNYALHGEANGVVLEEGDFLHFKPHGIKGAKLKIGQKITVHGQMKPALFGKRVIEVATVNGKKIAADKRHH